MSPSRAENTSSRLGSARDLFPSARTFFSARKSENCHFLLHREKKIGAKKATYKKTFQCYIL